MIKITEKNWNKLLKNPKIQFKTFVNGSYIDTKTMNKPGSFLLIRYVYPEDIIHAITSRLKSPTKYASRQSKERYKEWERIKKNAQELINDFNKNTDQNKEM